MNAAPLRASVIVTCFCYRAAAGLLIAVPLSLGVAGIVGHHPRGDAVLWEAGGEWLLECGRLLGPSLPARFGVSGILTVLLAFGWLFPLGALIASLSPQRLRGWQLIRRAWQRQGMLMLLLGVVLLLQAVIIVAMGGISTAVDATSRTRDLIRVALVAAGPALCWPLALIHDIARVLWVQRDLTFSQLVRRTFSIAWRRGGSAIVAAGWRTLVALAFLAAAVVATVTLNGGEQGARALTVCAQLAAVLVFVLMRASWLRWLTPLAQEQD